MSESFGGDRRQPGALSEQATRSSGQGTGTPDSGQNGRVQNGSARNGAPAAAPMGAPQAAAQPRGNVVPPAGAYRPQGQGAPDQTRAAALGGKMRAAVGKPQAGRGAGRKAHLVLSRVEPWSVMKFSFVISLVAFIILFVAVAVIYLVLSGLGVFDALTSTVREVTSPGEGNGGFDPAPWFSWTRILGYTAMVGVLDVILITAMCTVGAVLYNLTADLVGGVEVTLGESD